MNSPYTLDRLFPYILIITGLFGLLASGVITLDKMAVLADPSYVPPCNISPFISCGSIMNTPQASVFGFSNSLLGLVGFPIIITIGFALLAGADFKRWFWIGLQIGVTAAIAAVLWLFYQSAFVIHSLCPWCLVFWTATIPLFSYVTVYNLRKKHIVLPAGLSKLSTFIDQYPHALTAILFGLIITTIIVKFWSYWSIII